jgi:hypothetical protein
LHLGGGKRVRAPSPVGEASRSCALVSFPYIRVRRRQRLESVIEGYKAVIRDSVARWDVMTVSSSRMRDLVSESTSWPRPLNLAI